MVRKRLVTELGRGTDLQGRDYTKAAVRALSDALRRNSLTVVPALGYPRESMEVEITIGVARPDEVDREAVAATIPYGRATVEVVRGGLDVAADEGDGVTVIAAASAVVWLDIEETGDETGDDTRDEDGDAESAGARDRSSDVAVDGARDGMSDDAGGGPGERSNDDRRRHDGGRERAGVAPTAARRIILESGMGADLRGEDVTRAACRAVHDALHHSSLALFGSLGIDAGTMQVEIRLGVQRPDDVDLAVVAAEAPHGRVVVTAETGGLDVRYAELGTRIVVATAAVIARLPLPEGRFRLDRP